MVMLLSCSLRRLLLPPFRAHRANAESYALMSHQSNKSFLLSRPRTEPMLPTLKILHTFFTLLDRPESPRV
ncbi:hypothetical protein FOCG_18558 [Fusarium oxysporum f. sp. radicis-lycopersici 26381]|nr:hypothetical protein FOCG_18558 [Fusarium oxysporum f. sp. radicis-lycopersici 26381]